MSESKIKQLEDALTGCMLIDQHRITNDLRAHRGEGRNNKRRRPRSFEKIQSIIDESIEMRQRRAALTPKPEYDADLPIAQHRDMIMRTIESHQVTIICGATGSGKTTQLPKMCLELGRGVAGLIGHTQPRRLAARTVASRIATELKSPLGKVVGYKVRFNDHTDSDSLVKLMTDGILLAETQSDRNLLHYDTIIVDEAHERSLNIDFLLGYLKHLLPRRPDLKLIITSATIDPERFSKHFNDAPIINVEGRTYPVEMRYRPLHGGEDGDSRDVTQAILDAVDELAEHDAPRMAGDVLVFLPGEREIRETAEALRGHHPPGTEILPLFARLSVKEQNKVFAPHQGRRVVLATNVAETSLTVPGIRHVIDPGLARLSRYTARRKVQMLPIEAISQASADQRAGRCGRVAPGVCIRLYSEEDYIQRPEHTDPEIQRTNLASVILQMRSLRLGNIEDFPFIDPPRRGMVRDGIKTLHEIGALDDHEKLTDIGRRLARLPLDPRIGRMVLQANNEHALTELLPIAAVLSAQDPRYRPADEEAAADAAHERFHCEHSDFQRLLNIWEFYQHLRQTTSWNKLRKACTQNYISFVRLREWEEVHRQLKAMVTQMGMKLNPKPADSAQLHRSILAGLLGNIAMRDDRVYKGAGGKQVSIFPGSGLFKRGPQWIVAGELIETSRLYARTVARIQPEWLEDLAPNLLKRRYNDPHWNPKSMRVMANEKVTLFGLPIIPKRRVHYGPIDPDASRKLFIHHALVEGEYITDAPFFEHNRKVVQHVEAMQARVRRRDLLADASLRFSFFDSRLGEDVYSGRSFDRWRRREEQHDPDICKYRIEDLIVGETAHITVEQYPEQIAGRGVMFDLSYTHDPGNKADGVTVTIPIAALNAIDERRFDWLVPGMLAAKIEAIIRTLPKAQRTLFVPVPQTVDACMAQWTPLACNEPLITWLIQTLRTMRDTSLDESMFSIEEIPDYLRMHMRVVDAQGNTLASGRDLEALYDIVGTKARTLLEPGDEEVLPTNLKDWSCGTLEPERIVTRGHVTMTAYPALRDDGESVSVQLLEDQGRAARMHRNGVRRLAAIELRGEIMFQIRALPDMEAMRLHWKLFKDETPLDEQLLLRIVDETFLMKIDVPRTDERFRALLNERFPDIGSCARRVGHTVHELLQAYRTVELALTEPMPTQWDQAVRDIETQLEALTQPGFLIDGEYGWLAQYPRYFQAMAARLRKLGSGGFERDARQMQKLLPRLNACQEQLERNERRGRFDANLIYYRWMLEEFRVSLFAQELGTAIPISDRKLDDQWSNIGFSHGRTA